MRTIWIWVACAVVAASLTLVVLCPSSVAKAQSEGDVPLQIEATGEECGAEEYSFSAYFERNWLDKVVQFGFVLLGALGAIAATLKRVKAAHALLSKDGDEVKRLQKELLLSGEQMQELAKNYALTKEALDASLAALEKLQADLQKDSAQTNGSLDALREAMRLAYCTDPDLVKAGYAKQIAAALEAQNESAV